MRRVLNIVLASALLLSIVALSPIFAGSVKGDYKRPTVTVPYARKKPTIDGVINQKEWQRAESVNALQTTRHQISVRQTRFWMMWDEDNIYVAMRSPLRPGERVIQAHRRRNRDINVVFDDSYEVWLDVGSTDPKTGLECFYQFLCNYAGARYDVLHLPSVGNSRLGWSSGWEPKNRITDDNEWEWELVIPRDTLGKEAPFEEGVELTCLIARNYKRPWEQNSFEGTSSFSVLETHSKYVLSKKAPAVHLLSVGDPEKKQLGLKLAAYGQKDTTVNWKFVSDGGVNKSGKLKVKKGQFSTLKPMMNLDQPGKGYFRITVTSEDGSTLLDWCAQRQFGFRKRMPKELNDRGDVVKVSPRFNPVHNYVRITGDFINYDARDTIDMVKVQVFDENGKELGQTFLKIDELAYVEGVLQLGDVPCGEYTTKITCLGKNGEKILSEANKFSKKDHAKAFDWWNTEHGNIEKVISPWEPVTFEGNEFGVWGRTMKVGAGGLPEQIVTRGTRLLAAPAELLAETADGQTLRLKPAETKGKVTFNKDHRKTVEYVGKLGSIEVRSQVKVEFDGMYKISLQLAPKSPVSVRSLEVIVLLTGETANYVHAAGSGIRTGFNYGFLPRDEKGVVWTSRKVDSQPMRAGSFIPYVWVGSTKGGLCWFADSDEGWVPNDETPAIEIRRMSGKRVDFALNLISEEFRIEKPREIVFAFQASPVKPMHDKWRMDSWWCGDTFKDWAQCGSTIWNAIPYCRDIKKCKKMVEQRHKGKNSYIFGFSKYRANAVPYFIHKKLPGHLVPEVKYFGDQWRTSISDCLYYGKTVNDYFVHNYAEWCRATGIDGYYVDNMRPVVCDNIEAGRGYRLPDGRIQPTYQMFSTRRYFLRMRAAFAEQGKHNKIVLHMTNNMIIPWVGAADIAYDGEHHVIYPEMGKDFMDFWSLERLRVDYPGQWGTAINFMHEYQGKWDTARLVKAMRAYSGAIILHDGLPSGNANGKNQPLWIGRDRFGIEADDVEFIGYWEEDTGARCDTEDVYLAVWKRPGKVLVAVVNWGEKTNARVVLDPNKLGLDSPAKWTIKDAEVGTSVGRGRNVFSSADSLGEIQHNGKGVLTVPVPRHDYRQVIVE